MAVIWLISDTHFGHDNIIKYCSRPFGSAAEMDEVLVANWNRVVLPHHHVWHLGDVAMKRPALHTVQRLAGHKRVVLGNHDIFTVQDYLAAGFEKVAAIRVIDNLICTHIPIHPASLGRFRANVHGHIHEAPAYGPKYVNVSVEAINYTPVLLEDVVYQIATLERQGK